MGARRSLWGFAVAALQTLSANERPSGLPIEYHQKMLAHFSGTGDKADAPYFLESIGGIRDDLADRHITLGFAYGNDVMANPVGGMGRGLTNEGSFLASLSWDPHEQLTFYVSAVHQSGTSLSQRRIGNIFPVQQLSLTETLFLNELLVRYTEGEGRLQLKLGRLNAANDFLQSIFYYNYVSAAFNGNPAAIFLNIPFSVYPVATWGAVLNLHPVEEWEWRGGIFNANSSIFENRYHGLNFTFRNTNGWLLMTELHYRHQLAPQDTGFAGRYVVGCYAQTGRTDFLRERRYSWNYGGYLMLDQMVYRFGEPGSSRGITPWMVLLLSPTGRNRAPLYFNMGCVIQGPDRCRPDDSINFGLAHGLFAGSRTCETLLELNYWWQVRPYLTLTPAIQYVINPGGLGTIPDAFVLGFQVYLYL